MLTKMGLFNMSSFAKSTKALAVMAAMVACLCLGEAFGSFASGRLHDVKGNSSLVKLVTMIPCTPKQAAQ